MRTFSKEEANRWRMRAAEEQARDNLKLPDESSYNQAATIGFWPPTPAASVSNDLIVGRSLRKNAPINIVTTCHFLFHLQTIQLLHVSGME